MHNIALYIDFVTGSNRSLIVCAFALMKSEIYNLSGNMEANIVSHFVFSCLAHGNLNETAMHKSSFSL